MIKFKIKILQEDQKDILRVMKQMVAQIDYVKNWNKDQIDALLAGAITEKQMKKQLDLSLDHLEDNVLTILESLADDYVANLRKALELE